MSQNVMITGAGKAVGLGFNMVLRYLESGDNVVDTDLLQVLMRIIHSEVQLCLY